MRNHIDYDRVEFEKCMRGEMYNTTFRGRDELVTAALMLCQEYNRTPANDKKRREELVRELFGKVGKNPDVEPNVFCGFGFNVEVGDNFFANVNLVILDGAKVRIGNNAFIAPNVGIYTAGHPFDVKQRNEGLEYAFPVTIGDNVWIGAQACILPGVTIGDNTVIAGGSVVTKDIPANVIAAGNPCRVIREITEADRNKYRQP